MRANISKTVRRRLNFCLKTFSLAKTHFNCFAVGIGQLELILHNEKCFSTAISLINITYKLYVGFHNMRRTFNSN